MFGWVVFASRGEYKEMAINPNIQCLLHAILDRDEIAEAVAESVRNGGAVKRRTPDGCCPKPIRGQQQMTRHFLDFGVRAEPLTEPHLLHNHE